MRILGAVSSLSSISSIKGKLFLTYVIIIIVMIVPAAISFKTTIDLSKEYDKLIVNINYANELNTILKTNINAEMRDIVSGKKTFQEGNQFQILDDINNRLDVLYNYASTKETQQKIIVVKRTMITLSQYVYRLGDQIRAEARVSENEATLEVLIEVSSLAYDMLQEFTFEEIRSVAAINESLKQSAAITSATLLIVLIMVIIMATITLLFVTGGINKSINALELFAAKIAEGDLLARAKPSGLSELDGLTNSLNTMANRISELMEENIQKQKNLQKLEMQALQAQITPHFLYNTLDTIVWLAESEMNKEVINVTLALSSFFRISLSHGKEWINVEMEIKHIASYLTIQKMRYGSILEYSVSVDEALMDKTMLKLLLQPIVENSIYHGIKNSRKRGHISVTGTLSGNKMLFCVKDNGAGFSKERLKSVRNQIIYGTDTSFGLYNVNKRIKLYYDINDDITIESEPGIGTVVSFYIPLQ